MKPKYLFTILYQRSAQDVYKQIFGNETLMRSLKRQETNNEMLNYEEHIVAETWQQALEHWKLEFIDEGVDILSIQKQVPVVSIIPSDIESKTN